MLTLKMKGDFSKTNKYFDRMLEIIKMGALDKYGKEGVEALSKATPKDSGKTANSWYYEIIHKDGQSSIVWHNSNINDGVNIAVIIQYGHGTGTGAFVQGVDYINPTMKRTFDDIARRTWEEVKNA